MGSIFLPWERCSPGSIGFHAYVGMTWKPMDIENTLNGPHSNYVAASL